MAEEKAKEELGPRVFSNKNIADQYVNFSIVVGEMKNLPKDYEKSELIKKSLKSGDLVLMDNQTNLKVMDKDVTLDMKDVANFLNQNTLTVIKQLRINELSKKDFRFYKVFTKGELNGNTIVYRNRTIYNK